MTAPDKRRTVMQNNSFRITTNKELLERIRKAKRYWAEQQEEVRVDEEG